MWSQGRGGGISELAGRSCGGEAKELGLRARAFVGSDLGNGFGLLLLESAPECKNLRGAFA